MAQVQAGSRLWNQYGETRANSLFLSIARTSSAKAPTKKPTMAVDFQVATVTAGVLITNEFFRLVIDFCRIVISTAITANDIA